MKSVSRIATSLCVASLLCPQTLGFVTPSARFATRCATQSVSSLAVSAEEDIELTRKVIIEYIESIDANSGGIVDDDDEEAAPAVKEDAPKKEKKQKKKKKSPPPPAPDTPIDISKLNIIVGTINKAWEHETADKLFCEEIDCGEESGPRQIASGLRAHYTVDDLVGRKVCILANLKTRKLMGFPSHGMVLCASTDDDGSKVVFVDPPSDAKIGERINVDGYNGEPATENQVLKKKMLDAIFPDLRTDGEGVACYKGVPLTAGGGACVAEGGLGDAQVS